MHFEMHCDCGRRLSKGQASLSHCINSVDFCHDSANQVHLLALAVPKVRLALPLQCFSEERIAVRRREAPKDCKENH